MNAVQVMLSPEETQAVLSAGLRETHGADARLEDWTAYPLTKRGKRRAVHYQLRARVDGTARVQCHDWVGKFYDRDEDARRVATILRELAAAGLSGRGAVVIPGFIAHDSTHRVVLSRYELGESTIAATAKYNGRVLAAIGRAMAALHATPVSSTAITSPASLLGDLEPRLTDLCARFRGRAARLLAVLARLERQLPQLPAASSLLHGDLGPSHLLWQRGRIVVLDFDKWTRGDPAADLGHLVAQLRRLTLRKPGKLPSFASVCAALLRAYQSSTPPDPGLARRIAWYERVALLRKIHFLVSNTTRHEQPEALRRRRTEAIRLLREVSGTASDDAWVGDRHAS